MIKPNWEFFSGKFSDKEVKFEWLCYLLFCREFGLNQGWHGYENQADIEIDPIIIIDKKTRKSVSIAFQAKFYTVNLTDRKTQILKTLEGAKQKYPDLERFYFYSNKKWYQNKGQEPKAKIEIEQKARDLGLELIWRLGSYFDSEDVVVLNFDLVNYFFSNNYKAWKRYEDWSSTKSEINSEYFIDDDIKVIAPNHKSKNELNIVDGINEIRQQLSQSSRSVRLVGLSGVGKTRFAQALFDEKVGENSLNPKVVWYCDLGDSPDPIPEYFIDELVNKNTFSILIVDNCGQDTHANLTKKIQGKNLSLLTIEYDVREDLPEGTSTYKLKPISVETVQKVIERHYPNINSLNSRKIADSSGGNYRLALAIASNIEQTENISMLTDNLLFERLFWQNREKDHQLERIAQQFSLVYSFNIEDSGEENSEIDFLSNLTKIDPETTYEEIEKLRQKDIIQQRSIWRAILPHALANHLAKQAILRKSIANINRDFQQMPKRLKRSFIKRLSYLHDQEKVQQLIQLWLSEDGWLGKAIFEGNYNSENMVYLSLVAPIVPKQALDLIERVHSKDSTFLSRENLKFAELSNLIRRLAYHEDNFEQAFKLLAIFCQDEKEDENNNSIKSLITSLFKLYTSETLATLETKKEVLLKFSQDEKSYSLLLKICDKALSYRESGSLYNYNDSGENMSYGYQPQTYGEVWAWTEFLLELLNQLDILNIYQARKIFANNLRSIIWESGRTIELSKYLTIFNQRKYFHEAYTKITEILTYSKEEIEHTAPILLLEINKIQEELAPKIDDVSQLLETYVFSGDFTLFRLIKEDDEYSLPIHGFENYEQLIKFLIIQIRNKEILDKNIEKLINLQMGIFNNNYLENLGNSSAEVFESIQDLIIKLEEINIDTNLRLSEFLIGIAKSIKQRSLKDYQLLIEYLTTNPKFKGLVNSLILIACQTDEDIEYYSSIIKDKKVDLNYLPRLSAHKHQKKITDKQFELLLDSLVEINDIKLVQRELLEECFFKKKLAKKYENILVDNFYDVLIQNNLYDHSEYALKYIFTLDHEKVIKTLLNVKKTFDSERYIALYRHSKIFKILKICIKNRTTDFIKIFLEDKKFMKKFFNDDLQKILVYANENDVLSWIDNNQNKLFFWIEHSRLILIEQDNKVVWIDLVNEILNKSISPDETLSKIIEVNIFTIWSATGSLSEEMERRLQSFISLKVKLESSHPELIPLINEKEVEWLKCIDLQSKQDEQRSRKRSERFDW